MSGTWENYRLTKEQRAVTHKEERSEAKASNPEMSQKRELVYKDTKTVPTAALNVLTKPEESLSLVGDVEGVESPLR